MLALRSATMRSRSMPLLSQNITATGRPKSAFSRGMTLYTHWSVKKSGQLSSSLSSMHCT
jgi:hypothetical protein